jgi:3alpha(or 20beta)-hydroxysteroid dehydrogenase
MTGRLDGKITLITGAARGQGAAAARRFVAEGARVIIADVNDDAGKALADELGDAADYRHLDVGSEQEWADLAGELERLDVLVNNAGVLHFSPLPQTTLADYERVIRINQVGTFLGMRSAIEPMTRAGGGSIINISSIYGREAGGPLTYNASKAAMISFTKMLSRELAPKGIRVNTIAPGSILYPGGNWEKAFKANPAFEKDFLSHEFPAGRLGRPEEVAYAVVCLASPRASWITGTCLPVDGAQGRSLI